MIKRLLIVLASVALLAAAILGGLWYGARWLTKPADPVTIAAASLQAVREFKQAAKAKAKSGG